MSPRYATSTNASVISSSPTMKQARLNSVLTPTRASLPAESIRGKISNPIPISSSVHDQSRFRDAHIRTTARHGPGPSTFEFGDLESSLRPVPVPVLSSRFEPDWSSTDRPWMLSFRSVPAAIAPDLNPSEEYDKATSGSILSSAMPKRKRSTLRSALFRLFGKRRREGHQDLREPDSTPPPSGGMSYHGLVDAHRSQPPAREQVSSRRPKDVKRSNSMPINELGHVPCSHSIVSDDMAVVQSAGNEPVVDSSFNRRRAATIVPPASHSYLRMISDNIEPSGLSPRPASPNPRGSRVPVPEISRLNQSYDPEEIGRAIISDPPLSPLPNRRRRSRSLSGLRELVDEGPGMRRWSDEIRYWRDTYPPDLDILPETGVSSVSAFGLDADHAAASTLAEDLSPHSSTYSNVPTGISPIISPGRFNFELDATPREGPVVEGEPNQVDPASIVSDVEGRLLRLETLVAEMVQSAALSAPPASHQSPLQTPLPAPPADIDFRARNSLHTAPSKTNGMSVTWGQYEALANRVQMERAARLELAAKVRRLERQPAAVSVSTTWHSETRPASESFAMRKQSVFEHDDDDDDPVRSEAEKVNEGAEGDVEQEEKEKGKENGIIGVPEASSSEPTKAVLEMHPWLSTEAREAIERTGVSIYSGGVLALANELSTPRHMIATRHPFGAHSQDLKLDGEGASAEPGGRRTTRAHSLSQLPIQKHH